MLWHTRRMSDEKPDASALVEPIEAFLTPVLAELAEAPPTNGRPRIVTALALWAGLLLSVARGFSAQLEIWRLLTQTGLWDFPRFAVSDDAIYKRLKNASRDTFQTLFAQVTALLRARLSGLPADSTRLAPFARGV